MRHTRKLRLYAAALLGLLLLLECRAEDHSPTAEFTVPTPKKPAQAIWDLEALKLAPVTYPVELPEFAADEETYPVFYEGLPYAGKPTRVFAWVGIPSDREGKVPGIVLIHGGGGSAFREWTQTWVDRGYAVIAMDTAGGIPLRPEGKDKGWQRHPYSGPNGWGGFKKADLPVHEQWLYHATADVLLGTSLLASLPEVDANRIGVTGISWGGVLTNIVVGLDSRFKFGAPVYGCGFLGENSSWQEEVMQELGREMATRWVNLWDPGQYVGDADVPMLFCNGTNDRHFRMDSWQKTYRATGGPYTLSLKVRMRHAHAPIGDPPEITVFADSILKDGTPLAEVLEQGMADNGLWLKYDAPVAMERAELVYTLDAGSDHTRRWQTIPAVVDTDHCRVEATIPAEAKSCYLNLYDERGCIISSEHITL